MLRQPMRLCLLNLPRLELAGKPAHVLERRDAALLAWFALEGPTPRQRVARLIWPASGTPRAADNNLRQRLFRLRKSLGREVVVGDNALHLAEGVAHDLVAVEQDLADDPAACTGDVLGAFEYNDCTELAAWVRAVRMRWRAARSLALEQIAQRLEAEGRIAQALRHVERLVADEPTLESAHRRLMRLHQMRGDQAAAIAAYERFRASLMRDLDAAPAPETSALLHEIRRSANAQHTPAPPPITMLRPPRLVGRATEWAALEAALAEGRNALIVGEAGMGKTRMLADLGGTRADLLLLSARPGDRAQSSTLAQRLLRALVARSGAPSAPWVNMELARLAPELGAPPAAALDLVRLVEAFAHLLDRAYSGGLRVLALDDLHHADDASVESVVALAATDPGRNLRWVLGVRAGEMPEPLGQWILAPSAAVPRIALGALDLSATRELLAGLEIATLDADAWAEPLWRRSGGNPLFVLETVRAMLARGVAVAPSGATALPVPANLREMIHGRLRALSARAQQLAQVAALAGRDFGIELASSILACHALDLADAWAELEVAQVLRDGVFAHDLIAEVALQQVAAASAAPLHGAIADWLERHDEPAATTAAHWEAAGNPARAGEAFARAARRARSSSRRADELNYWEAAAKNFALAGRADAAFDARRESIDAVLLVHGGERAQRVAEELVAASPPDTAQRVDALLAMTQVRLMAVEREAAIESARRTIELADRLGLPAQHIDAAGRLASALTQMRRVDEAAEILAHLEPLVGREGTLRQRYDYWSALGYLMGEAGGPRRAAAAAAKASSLADELGDRAEVMTTNSNLAIYEGYLGRFDVALRLLERVQRMREELGEISGVPAFAPLVNLGVFLGITGRYREALQRLETALAGFRAAGHATWIGVAENHLAQIHLALGSVTRARKSLSADLSTAAPSTRARRLMMEARIERALGRPGIRHVEAALRVLDEGDDQFMRLLVQLEQARELAPRAATVLCETVYSNARRMEYEAVARKGGLILVEALLRLHDHEHAAREAQASLARLDDGMPGDIYMPEAWWILFQALDAGGDTSAAIEVLRTSVDWIHTVALPNVPEEFKEGFLDRNPVNRAILTTASRRLRN